MLARLPRSLLSALLVAFLVRLAWISLYPVLAVQADAQVYVNLAQSLLAGQGYVSEGDPITHYMPGWPIVLTVPLGLGLGIGGVRVLLCLLSTLVCLQAYLLGERLVSQRAGIVAAWFGALFPPLIWYCAAALSETVSAAVFGLWAISAVTYVQRGGGPARVVLLGLLGGVLTYFRAEMLVMAPLPFVARAFLPSVPRLREAARALSAVALTLLALAPWAAYNHARLGKPVWLTTAGGMGLWVVAHDPPIGDFGGPEFNAGAAPFRVPGHPELTDRNLGAEARRLIHDNPGRYLVRRLVNLPRFWLGSQTEVVRGAEPTLSQSLATRNIRSLALKMLGFSSQIVYAVCGLAGLMLFARRRETLLPWLLVGAKVAAHAPFVQTTRYSLHLAPLLLCYAGATLLWLWSRRPGAGTVTSPAADPSR